jgi:hypothetical protein
LGAFTNVTDTLSKRTALYYCIENGHSEGVKFFLKQGGVKLLLKDDLGYNPI